MGITVQHKRGTEAQVAAYTGVNGEIVFDTTNNKLVAMNGALAGGFPLAKASEVVGSINGSTGAVTLKTLNGGSLLGSGNIVLDSLIRSERTINSIIGVADKSSLIDITSGTFTQTFTAAAILGSGWFLYLKNSGTGDITLDPNGAELIDGLTSFVMYPGECRLIQCDGLALRSIVMASFYRVFTSSGSFIKPPGYSNFSGLLWGGGGSGSSSTSGGVGGGGGACAPVNFRPTQIASSASVVIAAGGLPAASASSGSTGGTSSFAGISSYGGSGAGGGGGIFGAGQNNLGGYPRASSSASVINAGGVGYGGAPGAGTSGTNTTADFQASYGGGGGGGWVTSSQTISGGQSLFGGGGGGGNTNQTSTFGIGGASNSGGAGGAGGSSNGQGSDGLAPGGGGGGSGNGTIGGGGSTTSLPSGAGARGELRIWGLI
jgi:hypothetical protein